MSSRPALRRKLGLFDRVRLKAGTCCSGKPVPQYEVRRNRPGRITWDENKIETDTRERGVLYGTMTIEDAPTPFLLYDSQMSRAEGAVVEIGEGHVRQNVDIGDLQQRLGILK